MKSGLNASASISFTAPAIEVDSLESSKRLITCSFGAAAFPLVAVSKELKREALSLLTVDNFSISANYFLGYNDKRELSPAALEFISLFSDHMKSREEIELPHS